MTILQQLTDDHAFFKETFAALDTLVTRPEEEESILRASTLVQTFRERHRVHLYRESSVLFPSLLGYLQMGLSPITRAAIYHHLQEEHMGVGRNVYLLEMDLVSRPLNAAWLKSYKALSETFIPHMANEEETVFPEAARVMPPEQLETMAHSKFFPAF